jgi:hypothetical protein
MASGDAQRTWFPEMVAMLRYEWTQDMSMNELILLRNRLDSQLQRIRKEIPRKPLSRTCVQCGASMYSGSAHISVRAMILSLKRFKVAEREVVVELERSWKSYRSTNKLDLYGQPNTV